MCGEQLWSALMALMCWGSSPRVRGTAPELISIVDKAGIIPACAGNRQRRETRKENRGDHPRVCGEQYDVVIYDEAQEGSSPRVRGTVGWFWHSYSLKGIIPACAGNSLVSDLVNEYDRDHPRVCGEQ